MSPMTVDVNRCQKDGSCVSVCPSGAISFGYDGFPTEFSEPECILCGQCMAVCATGALSHPHMPVDGFEPVPEALPSAELVDGLLKSRRSIRAYKDRSPSHEAIQSCLDIARRAPSAQNSQKLRWIVLEGKDKVRELAKEVIFGIESVSMQPGLLEQWERGEDKLLRGAPMVVVACAPTEYAWGKEDAAIALTYFELAAKPRGLGVCWAGYLTRIASVHAPVRWQLKVPDGYSVRGAVMVGESEHVYRRIPPRKPLNVQWC